MYLTFVVIYLEIDVWSKNSSFKLEIKDESVATVDQHHKLIIANTTQAKETSVSMFYLKLCLCC